MNTPPPLPPSLIPQVHPMGPTKKGGCQRKGCVGAIAIGVALFVALGVAGTYQGKQKFARDREKILADMRTAAAAGDHKRVIEIAEPHSLYGDKEFNDLLAKSKDATSFFGSIRNAEPSKVTPTGVRTINGDHWYGAASRELYSQLTQYAIQQDDVAFKRAMVAGSTTGSTTSFKDKEEVFITDTAILSGIVKIRRKGSTIEYWTAIEATK